jgi:hypothetical protein
MNSVSEQFRVRLRVARERLVATNIIDAALAFCIAGLGRVEAALGRPIRVVILGERNSGKTSVADLLIGNGLLPTSVVTNTHVPILVNYAKSPALHGVDLDGNRIRIDGDQDDPPMDMALRALQVALPLERLRNYQILDTPPSVAPAAFVDGADIVIWCTVATRAWTESERAAWAGLPQRCRRNALLVATHSDDLQTEADCDRVMGRLRGLTSDLFRDVILVAADGDADTPDAGQEGQKGGEIALRETVDRIATEIAGRRTRKADKIVRRLARLTFHDFEGAEVRSESAMLLDAWDAHAASLLEDLAAGRKTVPATIQDLLAAYALCAEMLRPGVVTGDSISGSRSHAVTAPVRWPSHNSAAGRLVAMLVCDLTGLLRMLAEGASVVEPPREAEYQSARAVLLSLADLDGAFEALGRMLGPGAAHGGDGTARVPSRS